MQSQATLPTVSVPQLRSRDGFSFPHKIGDRTLFTTTAGVNIGTLAQHRGTTLLRSCEKDSCRPLPLRGFQRGVCKGWKSQCPSNTNNYVRQNLVLEYFAILRTSKITSDLGFRITYIQNAGQMSKPTSLIVLEYVM